MTSGAVDIVCLLYYLFANKTQNPKNEPTHCNLVT